ncbi:TlpA family protein disulfide reductase [Proteiniphilum sp. UBA1028]|uniref:TlpA family protein disulfide reductase n=1 Tax=Proteiniphilum sp. UBA1028 TaxID=1947251 RepID=UPI0025CD1F9B|nr:TlpA disulfide reductase family protein [Proteiniphilum sp. UBA1028]
MKYVNFCLIAMFSLALSSGSVKDAVPSIGYYPGERLPDIVLTDIKGDSCNLSDYKGKKVVVNFWASYDARSRATNVRLHNFLKMTNADVVFLSISFDQNIHVVERTLAMDNLDTISQFCEVNGPESGLYKDFRLNRGFRNYLIDENGVIKAMNFTSEDLSVIL